MPDLMRNAIELTADVKGFGWQVKSSYFKKYNRKYEVRPVAVELKVWIYERFL
jgi:hypothetical protein